MWIFICEFELFARILKEAFRTPPFASIMLIPVSSQDVSMLKILMCARYKIRTYGLLNVNETLYQLS